MQHLFDHKVNVIRATFGTNEGLGTLETSIVHIKNLPCSVKWSVGGEARQFGKMVSAEDFTLYCNVAEIKKTDRIVVDGETFEILGIQRFSHYLAIKAALVE